MKNPFKSSATIVLLCAQQCLFAIAIGVPIEFANISRDSLLLELHRNGFWEATIDSARGETLFVNIGKAAIIESLTVITDDSLTDYFYELTTIHIGDTLKTAWIEKQQRNFVSALENMGYPFASCTTAISVIQFPNKIGVVIKFIIDRGLYVVLERLAAQVDGQTKPSVIAHAMLFRKGKPYVQRDIERGILRLQRSGIVSIIGQPYPAMDAEGRWALVIKAKDLATTAISGIMGYNDKKLSGDLEFLAKNIFGTGRTARFYIFAAGNSRKIELLYREPFIGESNISPEAYSCWQIFDSTYSRREHRFGVHFPFSFEVNGYAGISLRRTVPGKAGQYLPHSESFGLLGTMKLSTLDHATLPSKGIFIEASATGEYINRWGILALREFGFRASSSALVAIHKIRWITIWLHASGWGWISPAFPPQSDWQHIGGWRNLRGYREDQFAGCRLIWASMEPRIILANNFHLFPFIDFGMYRNEIRWNRKYGYGGGIEYLFGAGTFSIEYGIGEGRNIQNGLVHFGMRLEM